MRLSRVALVVLIGIRVLTVVLITAKADRVAAHGHGVGMDTILYQQLVTHAGTPYRDFDAQMPPVTLGELRALRGPTAKETAVRLAWVQLTLDLLTILLIARVWGRPRANSYLVMTAPLVPFIYVQVDPLVVALVVASLALLERRHERSSGVLLAVAAFAKIWPVVLIPVLAARDRWRAAGYAVATSAVGVAAWMAWAGTEAPFRFFRFLNTGGWEIGSYIGTVVRAITHEPIRFQGGNNRTGSIPVWSNILLLVVVLTAAVVFAWLSRNSGSWALAAYAAVGTLILFGPIFSPQYILWLLPFAAISNRSPLIASSFAAAVGGALVFAYVGLGSSHPGFALDAVMAARNIATLIALGIAVWLLVRDHQAAARGAAVAVEAVG